MPESNRVDSMVANGKCRDINQYAPVLDGKKINSGRSQTRGKQPKEKEARGQGLRKLGKE